MPSSFRVCLEWIEARAAPAVVLGPDPPAVRLAHRDLDVLVEPPRADDQPPVSGLQLVHGIHAVQHQIQHDLLQGHPVRVDRRKR